MLTDQLGSILSDTTAIERLKREEHGSHGNRGSCLMNLSETFGRPFSLLWLLPTAVKYNGLTYEELNYYVAEQELEEHEMSTYADEDHSR